MLKGFHNLMPHHDLTTQDDPSLQSQWSINLHKCIDASPLVAEVNNEVTAFIGSHSGEFVAVSVARGEEIWRAKLGGRIEGSAAIHAKGSFVYVGKGVL